jgi:hypothetical protein
MADTYKPDFDHQRGREGKVRKKGSVLKEADEQDDIYSKPDFDNTGGRYGKKRDPDGKLKEARDAERELHNK